MFFFDRDVIFYNKIVAFLGNLCSIDNNIVQWDFFGKPSICFIHVLEVLYYF